MNCAEMTHFLADASTSSCGSLFNIWSVEGSVHPSKRNLADQLQDPSLFSSATAANTSTYIHKRSPLPSPLLQTHTHTHTEYSTWCVVPSISTGTMKSALLIGWRENTEGEMVGMPIHMSRAVYIHMALHNS